METVGPSGRQAGWPATASLGLLTGGAFAATFAVYPSPEGLLLSGAFALLAACAVTDAAAFRVPNAFTYSGLVIMIAAAALFGDLAGAVTGALVGGGFLLLISLSSRGKVGAGDAKLAAFGGAIVGGRYVIHALFLGSVAAAILCLALILAGRLSRSDPLPFAPFLSLGFAAVAILTGSTLGL